MYKNLLLVSLCLVCVPLHAPAQTRRAKEPRVRSVTLRDAGKYANDYTPDTLRISDVVLEDVRKLLDEWDEYVLQLHDKRADFRRGIRGEQTAFHPHAFLICADDIGKSLTEQRGKWLNQRVTVYLRIRDMGLTTNMYVGYVTKIELLDGRGKVLATLAAPAG